MSFLIGIDPGYKNLGAAILQVQSDKSLKLVSSRVFNPSKNCLELFPPEIRLWINESINSDMRYSVKGFSMERYVPYAGVNSSDGENIQSLIGMLRYASYDWTGFNSNLYRAVEWKTNLVKTLFKQGFRNPSDKLDKKFSIAAAAACLNLFEKDFKNNVKTDHEADAICLAAYPFLTQNK